MAQSLSASVTGMQWLVLRRHVRCGGWWVPATVLGGILPVAVLKNVGSGVDLAAAYGALGPLVGIMQWLVLRQHIPHSGLWLLASTTG